LINAGYQGINRAVNHSKLEQLSRATLARLGREYMLAAQFNSRCGYAALRIFHGEDAYLPVAIDNWMAASPIYTQRMQRAMRTTTGSDIATILKGMQLECGLSHQYFDAGFREDSASEGSFWLNSCGPLLETEPRGEAAVKVMCHDIEDPTFDATAVATNPRARVRPVHRPPRSSANQVPHCKWRVYIDPDAEPLQEPAVTIRMRETALAAVELSCPESVEPGGLAYYDVPLFERLDLERFSHSALVTICKELAVQIHLLVNSLGMVMEQRFGREAADNLAEFQMTGSARVVSERLVRQFSGESGDIRELLDILQLHPAFQPLEYFGLQAEVLDERSARLSLAGGVIEKEEVHWGWYPLLLSGRLEGLQSLLQGIDPRASVERVPGKVLSWLVQLQDRPSSVEDPLAVQVAKGTVLYSTRLEDHIELLQLD
jgi:hypothetical protein